MYLFLAAVFVIFGVLFVGAALTSGPISHALDEVVAPVCGDAQAFSHTAAGQWVCRNFITGIDAGTGIAVSGVDPATGRITISATGSG